MTRSRVRTQRIPGELNPSDPSWGSKLRAWREPPATCCVPRPQKAVALGKQTELGAKVPGIQDLWSTDLNRGCRGLTGQVRKTRCLDDTPRSSVCRPQSRPQEEWGSLLCLHLDPEAGVATGSCSPALNFTKLD